MVLIPTTSPRVLISGPPELPGLMAASVWIIWTEVPAHALERDVAPHVGHDADRHAVVAEAERVADGHHPLADLELVGVAERQRRERGARLDLDQGDVGARVLADDLRLEALAPSPGKLTDTSSAPWITWRFVRM